MENKQNNETNKDSKIKEGMKKTLEGIKEEGSKIIKNTNKKIEETQKNIVKTFKDTTQKGLKKIEDKARDLRNDLDT